MRAAVMTTFGTRPARVSNPFTNSGMKSFRYGLAVLSVAAFGFVPCANADSKCGINWAVPSNRFNGINETGEFSYWRDIGQIDFGNGFKIPLTIGFRPNRGGSSMLGKSWIVPLCEANIIQIDERRFALTQPDGITRQFARNKPTDSILRGQGGWKGEIKQNTITLWAECGSKLVFDKGKIVTISLPKGRVLDVVYVNGLVGEVREKGRTAVALKVERDFRGAVKGFKIGENRVEIEMGERPRVDAVQGTHVVGGKENALHTVTLSDGEKAVFDFDVNEKLQPTLNISGDTSRSFTWDPTTGRLIKDGDWTYEIKSGKNRWANAAIGRINAQKQKEYWFLDRPNGREITETLDGVKTVRTWFTSGPLAGKTRMLERTEGDKTAVLQKCFYAEDGRLLRDIGPDGKMRQYLYDEKGHRIFSRYSSLEEIEAAEKALKAAIEVALDHEKQQELLYELAFFYQGERHEYEKSRELAKLLVRPLLRYNVTIASYDHDQSLSPAKKIQYLKRLQQEYPEHKNSLEELIQIRQNEI